MKLSRLSYSSRPGPTSHQPRLSPGVINSLPAGKRCHGRAGLGSRARDQSSGVCSHRDSGDTADTWQIV